MKRLLILFCAAAFLAACNTMEGFGKDVKKSGAAIEKAAKK